MAQWCWGHQVCNSPGLSFVATRWQLPFQILCPHQVRREGEGALGSCIYFIWGRKALPTPPAVVLFPLIGRYCQLTICHPSSKEGGKAGGVGVSQNHSGSHIQLSRHHRSILSPVGPRGDKTPILTEIPFSTTRWDTRIKISQRNQFRQYKHTILKTNNKKKKRLKVDVSYLWEFVVVNELPFTQVSVTFSFDESSLNKVKDKRSSSTRSVLTSSRCGLIWTWVNVYPVWEALWLKVSVT